MFQFPNLKILLIEVSETSQQYFVELQNEMILESSDVKMIPFSSIKDVGLLIYQCVSNNFFDDKVVTKAYPFAEVDVNVEVASISANEIGTIVLFAEHNEPFETISFHWFLSILPEIIRKPEGF